jgi:hypothetical protein
MFISCLFATAKSRKMFAFQDPDVITDPDEDLLIPIEVAFSGSVEHFEAVIAKGHLIELDHWMIYFARTSWPMELFGSLHR